jgi:hypothetical protein
LTIRILHLTSYDAVLCERLDVAAIPLERRVGQEKELKGKLERISHLGAGVVVHKSRALGRHEADNLAGLDPLLGRLSTRYRRGGKTCGNRTSQLNVDMLGS